MQKVLKYLRILPVLTLAVGIGLFLYLFIKDQVVFGGSLLQLGAYLILIYSIGLAFLEMIAILIAIRSKPIYGLIFFIFMIAVIGLLAYIKNLDNPSLDIPPKPGLLPMGSFTGYDASTFSGTLFVRGYAQIDTLQEGMGCEQDCDTYDYVYFHILQVQNPNFEKFMQAFQGNTFVKSGAIGLGCLENQKIVYQNAFDAKDSDMINMNTLQLDENTTSQILNSSFSSPIILQLRRKILTTGAGAPSCYAHFREYKIIR